MIGGLQNIPKIPELKKRIIFTLCMLIIYRVGCHIPTPGIDSTALAAFVCVYVHPFEQRLALLGVRSGHALDEGFAAGESLQGVLHLPYEIPVRPRADRNSEHEPRAQIDYLNRHLGPPRPSRP